jgi:hypothetical protein
MVLSAQIPQDVVDEIVSHLCDEVHALRICAIVSHSFHLPSRRLQFSHIVLNTPQSVNGLNRLLDNTPEISDLILHLHITHGLNEGDIPIPNLITRLTRLQHLVFGSDDDYGLFWNELSHSYVTALGYLVSLPSLRRLTLVCVYFIPLSFINKARGIRELEMTFVGVKNDLSVESRVPVLQLEALHLYSNVSFFQTSPPMNLPKFRQLSIQGRSPDSLKSAASFFSAASGTIDHVVWHDYYCDEFGVWYFMFTRLYEAK